jgi:hypothetical protein
LAGGNELLAERNKIIAHSSTKGRTQTISDFHDFYILVFSECRDPHETSKVSREDSNLAPSL